MNCNRFENLIWDYLEEQCNPQERQEMESHAARCMHCSQALATAKVSFALLRRLPKYDAPADLAEKTRARLKSMSGHNSESAGWLNRISGLVRWGTMRWAVAPAIGAILIGALWVQQMNAPKQWTQNNTQPVEARTLADEYADACMRIHEQVTASELNGDPTTDYLLMNPKTN